jgi:DNA-binding response OmpR family regulator
MKILVVEDEVSLREGLVDLLTGAGHTVLSAADGDEALVGGADPTLDLMILDLMLPKLDGTEVCRRLRELRPQLPILMLTARGSEDEKVDGFGAGADDYVTKPFSTKELVARVEALGRRGKATPEGPQLIECDDGCQIDLGRCEARRNGNSIPLTSREVDILRWLYQHRSRAVSRSELLEVVWGSPGDLQTRTVDMTVVKLRQKIEIDSTHPKLIITVKRVGYAWGEP